MNKDFENLIEIKDFEISITVEKLYWISYKDNHYPIFLDPYQLFKLFETEGIPITENMFVDEEKRIHFKKAILLRDKNYYIDNLYSGEDENDDRTLQECWVK